MKTPRLLFWTPRILCLLFAGFVSLFALDVFQEHHGFWNTMVALLIHLIPTGILLVLLAVSWRWEWIGAMVFPALGLFYIVSCWGRFPWQTYLIMTGPLVLVGVLFLLGWRKKRHGTATARVPGQASHTK